MSYSTQAEVIQSEEGKVCTGCGTVLTSEYVRNDLPLWAMETAHVGSSLERTTLLKDSDTTRAESAARRRYLEARLRETAASFDVKDAIISAALQVGRVQPDQPA